MQILRQSSLFVILCLCFSYLSLAHTAKANNITKIEQQINIINQEFNTTSTTSDPTDNSLGLIYWDDDLFNAETIYFEAVIYCSSCSGGNAEADAALYNDAGTVVTGSTVATTNSSYTRVRSADITSNITDDDEYTVRVALDASSGTAYIKSARLIILQSASDITDTQTQIEIGNNDTSTNTSYELLTGPKIFRWDADDYSSTDNVFFEATLQGSDGSATAYAALSLSTTCASTVTGSEVTISGATWDRSRSSDIEANLTDDTDYWVCLKASSGDTTSIANAKLIVDQTDAGGIGDTLLVHQYINTPVTDTDSGYTSQSFDNLFDPSTLESHILEYFFDTTINTTAGDAYSRLFNTSDTTAINNSELTTDNTSFTRLRTSDLRDNMPSSSKTLDTQLRNSAANTTTASTSWLIIKAHRVLNPALTFQISEVGASTINNGITTSVASTYNNLNFGHLTFGTPKYTAHELYASTNAPSGYTVTMELISFLQGLYPANNIDPFTASWDSPTTWSEPDGTTKNDNTGWLGANTTDTRVPNWGSASEKFGGVSTSPVTVMYSTTSDSGTTEYVTYALEANILQPADSYSGSLQYNIVPTY